MTKLELQNDIDAGLSSYKISKKYNKSQCSIIYWLKKYNLKTKHSQIGLGHAESKRSKQTSKYTTINWSEYQTLYDSGISWTELSKHGISTNAISWATKNGKLKMRTAAETRKIKHNNGMYNYDVFKTPEHRKLMSQCGGDKENSGRCKHILFKKNNGDLVTLQGSWEERLAIFLEQYNIKWVKNRIGYKYTFENTDRMYIPDFYLGEFDVYIEVKGYETEKDREKWKQFPFKLFIVKKQEINNLKLWWQSTNLKDILSYPETECLYLTLKNSNIKIERIKKEKITREYRKKDNLKLRRVVRPSKEILESEIKQFSMRELSRKYGVSDTAIRKWCIRYGIDYKSISKYSHGHPKQPKKVITYASKYKYVMYNSCRNKWIAYIKNKDKTTLYHKRFDMEEDAAIAVAKILNSPVLIIR